MKWVCIGLNTVDGLYNAILFAITHNWIIGCCVLANVAIVVSLVRRSFVRELATAILKPDSTEPIIAYRGWNIQGDDLHAIFHDFAWPARQAIAADVDSAGYYAFKNEKALFQVIDSAVVGRVALWGRIKEHWDGYRAEFAYPQILYTHPALDCDRIKRVAEKYGIETAPMPDELRRYYDIRYEAMQAERFEALWASAIAAEKLRRMIADDMAAYAAYAVEHRTSIRARELFYV